MRVLITGITGFAGSHLADYILRECPGVEVYGLRRWRSRMENVAHLEGKVKLLLCDLVDPTSVTGVLKAVRPDRIFHLAAESFVPTSWTAPESALVTNITSQLHLFESMREVGLGGTRIQVAGSSEEYGLVHENEVPIRETNPLRPLSPYAVSKVGQDLLGYQYFKSYGTHVIRTRGFNHTGPRRAEVFATSSFARQIATIEKGLAEPVIRVGNLDAVRDFTDVRDTVRAYWLSLEKGEPGEVYNIASGKGYRIGEMLDILLGFSATGIKVEQDPERLRPSDVPILLGDSSKFRAVTGWTTTIPFEKTLKDLLQYWRDRFAK
jgi:GDP-4-dehydro-6-deoxy-D-mannose reductase